MTGLAGLLIGLVFGAGVMYVYARHGAIEGLAVNKRVKFSHGPWARHYVVASITVQEGLHQPGSATVDLVSTESLLRRITVPNRST